MGKPISWEKATGEDRWRCAPLTADQVRALPASVELVAAAKALGLPREVAYEQAKRGELEFGSERVEVRRVGAPYRVTRADLMRVLGISEVPEQRPAPERDVSRAG